MVKGIGERMRREVRTWESKYCGGASIHAST